MEIKVTASVEYIYNIGGHDEIVSSPEAAIDDVWEMIASGEVTPSDFIYDWVEVD